MGHPYQAVIGARTMHGSGCPYCANRKVLPGFNDLATMEPKIAAQWHPTLNGSLTPEQVTAGSHRKVWWQCPDGHIWKAVIYSRAGPQKTGCPVCAGRIQPARVERYRRMAAEREQERLWDTLGLLTKCLMKIRSRQWDNKKDARWRHVMFHIMRFRFKAVAERRQWSSAASKPRRKRRVKLCIRF